MTGDMFRSEHNVMKIARSDVLLDPAFTMPAVPEVSERVIALIGRPERLSSPAATLLATMGLPASLEGDVAVVAQAYLPMLRCRRRRTRRRTGWWPRAAAASRNPPRGSACCSRRMSPRWR
jgi:hypothetical protein